MWEKTHCPKGHPYDEKNTYIRGKYRRCIKCNTEATKRYRERKKLGIRINRSHEQWMMGDF